MIIFQDNHIFDDQVQRFFSKVPLAPMHSHCDGKMRAKKCIVFGQTTTRYVLKGDICSIFTKSCFLWRRIFSKQVYF